MNNTDSHIGTTGWPIIILKNVVYLCQLSVMDSLSTREWLVLPENLIVLYLELRKKKSSKRFCFIKQCSFMHNAKMVT